MRKYKMTPEQKEEKKKLKNFCKKYGLKLEETRSCTLNVHEITVEAPDGYHFKDGPHQLVDCVYYPWYPDFKDMLDRISFGIEKCSIDSPCETYDENTEKCEWWYYDE